MRPIEDEPTAENRAAFRQLINALGGKPEELSVSGSRVIAAFDYIDELELHLGEVNDAIIRQNQLLVRIHEVLQQWDGNAFDIERCIREILGDDT